MSSNSSQKIPTEVFFRNANGERLMLEDKGNVNLSNADNIVNFALRTEKHFSINLYLTLFCVTFFIWCITKTLILFIILIFILILQCKSFITSIKQGKLKIYIIHY